MRRFPTITLFAAIAFALGATLRSEEGKEVGAIVITVEDLEVGTDHAREPALLLPGPQLFWSEGERRHGLRWDGAAWVQQATEESAALWSSGVWSPGQKPVDFTHLSATSLRNGVRRDAKGGIVGWAPDLQQDAEGRWHGVEDRFLEGSYQVVYRDPAAVKEWMLAPKKRFQAHASIALDAQGEPWVAWDEGGAEWGESGGLHEQRTIRLVHRRGDTWSEIALPPVEKLVMEEPSRMAPFASFAELPRLVMEADGPLWLFYRVMKPYTSPLDRTASRKVAWVIRAICLTPEGWSAPITLPESEGPNHDTLALLPMDDGGVLATWTTDLKRRSMEGIQGWGESLMGTSSLRVARLRFKGTVQPEDWQRQEGEPLLVRAVASEQAAAQEEDAGRKFAREGEILLWGDLHRHSDLSRCSTHVDGSVPDQYRYSAGTGRLDFVAVTDHHQHFSASAWDFLLDCADRFHDDAGLQTMFGFEAAFLDGHRNLVADTRDAIEELPYRDNLEEGVEGLRAEHLIAIPHQMAHFNSVLDWRHRNKALETQLEIFQRRGSYEVVHGLRMARNADHELLYAMDYLEKGDRFGFIASSDHRYSSSAFAVVAAKGRDRASILEALHARRSYAATARIGLDVSLGALAMGEEGSVTAETPLVVKVDAGSEIAHIDIIRNGKVAYSWNGSTYGNPSSDGLLTVQFGKLDNTDRIPLSAVGLEFGHGQLFDGEDGVANIMEPDAAWAPNTALYYGSSRAQAPGGWSIPVRLTAEAADGYAITLGTGKSKMLWREASLVGGRPWKRKFEGRIMTMRLLPAPIGVSELEESWAPGDWKKGDWVYVRVVRTDMAMAWSSPIWIDG